MCHLCVYGYGQYEEALAVGGTNDLPGKSIDISLTFFILLPKPQPGLLFQKVTGLCASPHVGQGKLHLWNDWERLGTTLGIFHMGCHSIPVRNPLGHENTVMRVACVCIFIAMSCARTNSSTPGIGNA